MNFTPNLVIGLGITGIGIALTLDKLEILEFNRVLGLWPVLVVLFGLSVVVQAFRPQSAGPMGGNVRQRPIVNAPVVSAIVIICLLSVPAASRRSAPLRVSTDENVELFAVLGGDVRSSSSSNFRQAEMTSVMGGSKLDLRQATIAPGAEAVIDVFAMMGGAVLVVPSDWIVDIETVSVMGGVKDERSGARRRVRGRALAETQAPLVEDGVVPVTPEAVPAPGQAGPPPRLVVRGFVMMGGLVIKS